MLASFAKYTLHFGFTAITSREALTQKDTYYIKVWHASRPDQFGLGEAALFRGLSCDDRPDFELKLREVCADIHRYAGAPELLADWPAIRMGVETAVADLAAGGRREPFGPLSPVEINGLIWMGDEATMLTRLRQKIDAGFKCIKIKIGGIDFERELAMLAALRSECPEAEIRLDANGAFSPRDALNRLERLACHNIHSIEQPIRQGQVKHIAEICRYSPIPVALDEELIGVNRSDDRQRLLDAIMPQYIILKPTLTGGFVASDEWIHRAEERELRWWATSALESDIGLNAIARWVSQKRPTLPQGLGTGQLYTNNIPSPLRLDGTRLTSSADGDWQLPDLQWNEC